MNTQLAFAFGMLAMIAIIMFVVIVVGMVKVIKLAKQLKELDQTSSKEVEFLHRHMTDVERGVYSELNDRFKDAWRKIDDAYTNSKDMANAYTDARIDKLEQKLTSKKQLLKD